MPRKSVLCVAASLASLGVAYVAYRYVVARRGGGGGDRCVKGEAPRRIRLSRTEQGLVARARHWRGAMKVALLLRLEGPAPTEERLQRVAELLQRRHPILRCRVLDSVAVEDEDVRVRVTVLQQTWSDVWPTLEKRPFSSDECVLELVLAPAQHHHDLVLVCQHAFCDGVSIGSLGHELMALLANTSEAPDVSASLPWSPPMEVMVSANLPNVFSLGLRWARLIAKVVLAGKQAATFPASDASIAASDLVHRCSTSAEYAQLSATELLRLLQQCRRYNTTVTGAISAAMLHACADFLDPGADVLVVCGVDLRKLYRPKLSSMHLGYHVSGVAGVFFSKTASAPASAEELWRLAERYRHSLKTDLDTELPMTIANLCGAAYQKPATHETGATSSISNWGVLPLQQSYGDWRLVDVRPFVNLSYIRMPCVLVTTAVSQLTIAVFGPSPALSKDVISAFRDKVMQNLSIMLS